MSEYRGRYSIGASELLTFHEPRWRVLADTGADLLACETLPSRVEAEVLLGLLARTPERWAWLSFSCRDGKRISDGTPLKELARLCDREPRVAAIGINCTALARRDGDRRLLPGGSRGDCGDGSRAGDRLSPPYPV